LELCCIVWIEPGVERTVPLAATDRTNEPIEVFPICLSVRSVQQLVQVYQLIMGTPAPGADNGRLASDPSLHRESPESPSSDSGGRSDYQVWRFLTATQQQSAIQTLIQISLELVQAAEQEAHDEHSRSPRFQDHAASSRTQSLHLHLPIHHEASSEQS